MPTRMTDAFGYYSTITYDPTQGDLPTSSTDLNNQSTTTSYSYDGSSGSNGKVTVSTKLPLESASYTTQSNTFSNCGSSNALPCFKVDSVSQQYSSAFTHTYYDSQGRVVETTQPVPVPASGNGSKSYIEVVFTTYKDQTNSVATSTPFVTTTDNANSIGWVDPNGVLDYKGKAPGLYVTYFDALGRPIAVMDPYFASGNETEVTCPGGSAATACSFYGFDNPQNSSTKFDYTATLDPNNHVSVSFRDSLGNTRHVQWYNAHYSGTGIGSIGSNVNEEENIQYSALNEPTSVADNDIGANTSVTASASYDDLGRLTSVTDPDRGNHIYSYDADGNLINDVSGTRTLGYNYDLLGRLGCVDDVTTILNATGSCTNTSTKQYLQYTYDTDTLGSKGSTDFPTGRLTKSKAITYFADGTSATVTEKMQYDARGRTITGQMLLSVPSAWEVASQLPTYYQWQPNYNDADQIQYFTTTTSSGSQGYTMSNVYDSTTGVLTGLGNSSGQTANLASVLYNQHGLVSTLNFQTSTGSALASEQFNYDANFRPTAATASWQSGSGTTGTIFSQTPSYDSASNVTSLSTTQAAVPGHSNSGGSETQNFCYDEQNRLVWAGNSGSQPAAGSGTCGSGTLSSGINGASYANSYTYTHLGQLSQIISNGTQSQYLYCNSNAPHQLSGIYSSSSTCSSRSGASYTSSYDSWGNVTSRTFSGITATLSYDSLDHLVEWNAGSTNQQWNVYDGSGNRVLSRSISSSGHSVTVYAFGLEEHTYSFDSGGTLLSQNQVYYYSLLGALEVGTSSNTNFFLTDALGSVLASISNTANSAAVQGNQLYDPYGNSRYSSGTIGTTKGFTGQYADATGLDYYGSRSYDPAASVFLSADPLQGDLAGANPYEYVGSNPETHTDPSGERFISPSGGQQGPLGPINSDNVPYTPPTYPSPGGLGAGQVGGNTLNLQPDACTQAFCKVSLATELDEFVPGTARTHVLAGGSSCAGSSSFSLVGIDGTLIAGGGGLTCTSVGGGQFQDHSAGQVVRHTFAFTTCVPWYACSDEDNQGDSSGGDEKASGSSMTDLAASDTGGETSNDSGSGAGREPPSNLPEKGPLKELRDKGYDMTWHFVNQWIEERRGGGLSAQDVINLLEESENTSSVHYKDLRTSYWGVYGKIRGKPYNILYDITDGNKLVTILDKNSGAGWKPDRMWPAPGTDGWSNPFLSE